MTHNTESTRPGDLALAYIEDMNPSRVDATSREWNAAVADVQALLARCERAEGDSFHLHSLLKEQIHVAEVARADAARLAEVMSAIAGDGLDDVFRGWPSGRGGKGFSALVRIREGLRAALAAHRAQVKP